MARSRSASGTSAHSEDDRSTPTGAFTASFCNASLNGARAAIDHFPSASRYKVARPQRPAVPGRTTVSVPLWKSARMAEALTLRANWTWCRVNGRPRLAIFSTAAFTSPNRRSVLHQYGYPFLSMRWIITSKRFIVPGHGRLQVGCLALRGNNDATRPATDARAAALQPGCNLHVMQAMARLVAQP